MRPGQLQYQIKKGAKVESEHRDVIQWIKRYNDKHGTLPTNKHIYRRIAETHIKEDENYYKKLAKMEAKR